MTVYTAYDTAQKVVCKVDKAGKMNMPSTKSKSMKCYQAAVKMLDGRSRQRIERIIRCEKIGKQTLIWLAEVS